MTDEQLLADYIASGSQESFGLLVRRHRPKVLAFLVKILKSVADAEDAAQITFIKAFQECRHFNGASRFLTWLCAIAKHVATDARRRKDCRQRHELHASCQRECEADYRIIDDLIRDEETAALASAVETLAANSRKVIELMDVKQEDAAKSLGIPVGTIKSRRHRAVRLLRERMAA